MRGRQDRAAAARERLVQMLAPLDPPSAWVVESWGSREGPDQGAATRELHVPARDPLGVGEVRISAQRGLDVRADRIGDAGDPGAEAPPKDDELAPDGERHNPARAGARQSARRPREVSGSEPPLPARGLALHAHGLEE
jgi:hypothetical protein